MYKSIDNINNSLKKSLNQYQDYFAKLQIDKTIPQYILPFKQIDCVWKKID